MIFMLLPENNLKNLEKLTSEMFSKISCFWAQILNLNLNLKFQSKICDLITFFTHLCIVLSMLSAPCLSKKQQFCVFKSYKKTIHNGRFQYGYKCLLL
jgi:hypothetical protein